MLRKRSIAGVSRNASERSVAGLKVAESVASSDISIDDIDNAFKFISNDNTKITLQDLANFRDRYIPAFMVDNLGTLLLGNESITSFQIKECILKKPFGRSHCESALKEIEPLSKLFANVAPFKSKSLWKIFMEKYDVDKDGKIGLEDFQKI